MDRLLAVAALTGFCLSLLVHISALLGLDASASFPFVWLLHAGIFLVFIPFVLASRKAFGRQPRLAELRAGFPVWIAVFGSAVFAYAVINFLVFLAFTEGGSPLIRDGKFVLQSHGQLIREITASEYSAFKANEIRGFSGHWLFFYYLPFAYFMFHKKPISL
jgi:hypothetical protein